MWPTRQRRPTSRNKRNLRATLSRCTPLTATVQPCSLYHSTEFDPDRPIPPRAAERGVTFFVGRKIRPIHIGHSQPRETLEDALSTSQIALSSSTRTPVRWFVYVYRTITSGFTKDWCPRFPPPPAGACRACRLGCGAPTAPSSLCRLARGSLLAAPPFSPPFPSAYCPQRRAWRSCPRRRQRGRTARCAACM